MLKIEMEGGEFDKYLMILWAKIGYCLSETDCRKCSLLKLKTSHRLQVNREDRNLHLKIEIWYS